MTSDLVMCLFNDSFTIASVVHVDRCLPISKIKKKENIYISLDINEFMIEKKPRQEVY